MDKLSIKRRLCLQCLESPGERAALFQMTKKSRIRETPTLLTDADSRTNTILEKLRNIYFLYIYFFKEVAGFFSTEKN